MESAGISRLNLHFTATLPNSCSEIKQAEKHLDFKLLPSPPGVPPPKPPNIIVPDGNGLNRYFEIKTDLPEPSDNLLLKAKVFNRWALSEYKTENRYFSWDAAGLPAGVYYYVITYTQSTFTDCLTIIR